MNVGRKVITGLGLLGAIGLAALTPAHAAPATPSGEAGIVTPQQGQPPVNGAMHPGPNIASAHNVAVLQEALDSTGANVAIDGAWGPATESALKHYQQKNGLPVTGKVDQATRAVLDPIG